MTEIRLVRKTGPFIIRRDAQMLQILYRFTSCHDEVRSRTGLIFQETHHFLVDIGIERSCQALIGTNDNITRTLHVTLDE